MGWNVFQVWICDRRLNLPFELQPLHKCERPSNLQIPRHIYTHLAGVGCATSVLFSFWNHQLFRKRSTCGVSAAGR